MAKRLQNRVAIVSGAGSSGPGWGNGKAAAVTYAREGAKVIALDVNIDAANETADIIRSENGICLPIACDVTQPADVEDAVAKALKEFGTIDVLHNNVGISKAETMETLSIEDWDHIIEDHVPKVPHCPAVYGEAAKRRSREHPVDNRPTLRAPFAACLQHEQCGRPWIYAHYCR